MVTVLSLVSFKNSPRSTRDFFFLLSDGPNQNYPFIWLPWRLRSIFGESKELQNVPLFNDFLLFFARFKWRGWGNVHE